MIINRENYQIWICDHYDGQLDPLQKKILLNFLERNPDLKAEFEAFSEIRLSAGNISCDLKKSLLRGPDELTEQQTDNYLIALCENDLSPTQADEIISLTEKNPHLKERLEIYKRIKLSPADIIYPWKEKLKKIPQKKKRRLAILYSLSAAASIIIILSITFFLNNNNVNPGSPVQIASADTSASPNIADIIIEEEKPPSEKTITINETVPTADRGIIIAIADTQEELIKETPREEINITPTRHIEQIKIELTEKTYLLAEAGPYPDLPPDFTESISIRKFLAKQFRKQILQDEDPGTDILKGYEIADAGIRGMNKLLGWEMEIETSKSESGTLNNVKFTSQLVNIDHSPKRNQEGL